MPMPRQPSPRPRPRPRPRRARLAAFALVLAAAGAFALPARAHDFWIEPSTYTLAPGQAVGLRLRVGQHFLGDALPRDPTLLARFVAASAAGERPVPGVAGTDPAGILRPAEGEGTLVVGYESNSSVAEMTAEKLALYFAEEGLDAVAAERRERGETGGASDVFSRHAKALLAVGGAAGPGYDRALGLELELVPEADPYARAGGGTLPVRLLRDGKPVAGTLITAIPRLHPMDVVSARTDAAGRATLALGSGEWLVKAVTVARARDGVDGLPTYRSRWASLTFRIPDRATGRAR